MLPPPEISVSSESTSLPPIPYSNLTKSAKLHISVDSKSIMFDTDFERAETTEWVRQVSSINFQMLDHRDFITVDGALYIDMLFSMEEPDIDLLGVKKPWREQDRKAFCKRLLLAMSDISSGRAMEMSFLEKIKAFEVAFDLAPNGLSIEKKTCLQLHKLVDNHTFITAAEDKAAYDLLYGKLTEKWKSCYDRSKLFLGRSDVKIPSFAHVQTCSGNVVTGGLVRVRTDIVSGRFVPISKYRGQDPQESQSGHPFSGSLSQKDFIWVFRQIQDLVRLRLRQPWSRAQKLTP